LFLLFKEDYYGFKGFRAGKEGGYKKQTFVSEKAEEEYMNEGMKQVFKQEF